MPDTTSPIDERLMRRALALARRGQGRVEPNPMVGCVIARDARVIGEGYHRRYGADHAETDALRRCREDPAGATVYVSLEPCCHQGKTPPCTDALIAARVGRVVAAMRDPDRRVRGRGFRRLIRAGIKVECGLLEADAAALNAPFTRLAAYVRPWVILKWAQSLDGRIATRTGDSKWISDETARHHAHALRGRVDAILVGVGTIRRDDPMLTCRAVRPRRVATRIVVDPVLRTPPDAAVVRTARATPTLILCTPDAPARRARALADSGCEVLRLESRGRLIDIALILGELGKRGMTNLLVEGGGETLGRFFDAGSADEVRVYLAPRLIGGRRAVSALAGEGLASLAGSRLRDVTVAALGDGWFVRGLVGRGYSPPTC